MQKRLKELRKSLGLNQTEFSANLGITQTAYSMIENGINPLADKYIKVICACFNVSENWLRTGEGEMFVCSPYDEDLMKTFAKLTDESKQYLLSMAKGLLKLQNVILTSNNE